MFVLAAFLLMRETEEEVALEATSPSISQVVERSELRNGSVLEF